VQKKKAAHTIVNVALLMVALLTAVASAGRGDVPMSVADVQCTRVGACSDSLCTEQYAAPMMLGCTSSPASTSTAAATQCIRRPP
jgi:hypothetical protein